MAANQSWIKNLNPAFQRNYMYKSCGRNIVYVNGDLIASPNEDNHIYKFKITSKTRGKYQFGNYKNIEYHSVCCSMDKQILFIYDGFENKNVLIIIDIKTMKIIKEINNMSG
eukprot:53349_1